MEADNSLAIRNKQRHRQSNTSLRRLPYETEHAFEFTMPAMMNPPAVTLVNTGTLTAHDRCFEVRLQLWQTYQKEEDIISKEEMLEMAIPWLKNLGFGNLPTATKIHIFLRSEPAKGLDWNDLYETVMTSQTFAK